MSGGFFETFVAILCGLLWLAGVVSLIMLFYLPVRMGERNASELEWWRWACLCAGIILYAAGMAAAVSF
jgi:hypothetical protein